MRFRRRGESREAPHGGPGRGPRRPQRTERSGPTRRSILTDFPYMNRYTSRGGRAIEADNWLAFSPRFLDAFPCLRGQS